MRSKAVISCQSSCQSYFPLSTMKVIEMRHHMTKPTKWMCAQRRLRSAWASAQSDQSSLCARWVAKDLRFLHADSEDSDHSANAQADLSLRWAHMIFCWFCHEVAQMYFCRQTFNRLKVNEYTSRGRQLRLNCFISVLKKALT